MLYGYVLKREFFFKRSKIFFLFPKIKLIFLRYEANGFLLWIFGDFWHYLKNFTELKKFTLKNVAMQHATLCHFILDCETSLSVLSRKTGKKYPGKPEKPGKNRSKTGKFWETNPVTGPNNFYYWTFLIISKKLFRPILADPAVLEQIWGHFWISDDVYYLKQWRNGLKQALNRLLQ